MNRQQRRAAQKQSPAAAADPIRQLLLNAARHQQLNEFPEAARLYKRLLAIEPEHAEAHNNLGVVLLAQGKRAEASAHFAHSLGLVPQLFDRFAEIRSVLMQVLPSLAPALQRAVEAWPQRLPAERLLQGGIEDIAADPLLLCALETAPVRDVSFERLLTSLRASLLDAAAETKPVSEAVLAFACALAKQCFINEYVFATTPGEDAQADALKAVLGSGAAIAPLAVAALAMYEPLHALPAGATLLQRRWPAAVDDLLTQQLRMPQVERELRDSIPRLTPIEDAVSQRVRAQYEENPYPRWVKLDHDVKPVAVEAYLREMFPTAAFSPLAKSEAVEVLVAGCGTGHFTIWLARRLAGTRFLAVDLSLSSLCFAKRMTPAAVADRIAYAQGDILKLDGLKRSFDVIDASGVLHHMADPYEGWRILLQLLRPGGFMHVCLYSERGRGDVVKAREFIAAHGYTASAADIRRCRQDLLDTPMRELVRFNDFFSTSDCRDMLFHVQESRTAIPELKARIAAFGLNFLGFAFNRVLQQQYQALFASRGWALNDLDRWHALELERPDTFSGMYELWLQKP